MWKQLTALKYVLHVLPMESLEKIADTVLDVAEDIIKETPTKLDDKILGSAIEGLREAFNIEDGDD